MNRRQLIRSSLAMAGLPPLCCTTPEIPPASFTIQGAVLTIDLQRAPELRKPGAAVRVVDLERKVNLIVVHSARNRFAALDRSCTHGGAQVVYNGHNQTVQCTSWGHSEFALDGAVLGGSAKRPVRAYEIRRAGDRLEIVLEAKA